MAALKRIVGGRMEGRKEVDSSHVIELPLVSLVGELIHHIWCVHDTEFLGPGCSRDQGTDPRGTRGTRDSRGLHCLSSYCGWICINRIREVA